MAPSGTRVRDADWRGELLSLSDPRKSRSRGQWSGPTTAAVAHRRDIGSRLTPEAKHSSNTGAFARGDALWRCAIDRWGPVMDSTIWRSPSGCDRLTVSSDIWVPVVATNGVTADLTATVTAVSVSVTPVTRGQSAGPVSAQRSKCWDRQACSRQQAPGHPAGLAMELEMTSPRTDLEDISVPLAARGKVGDARQHDHCRQEDGRGRNRLAALVAR